MNFVFGAASARLKSFSLSLGTMLAFVFFEQFAFARPVMAFAGAGIATFAVYQMAITRAG